MKHVTLPALRPIARDKEKRLEEVKEKVKTTYQEHLLVIHFILFAHLVLELAVHVRVIELLAFSKATFAALLIFFFLFI